MFSGEFDYTVCSTDEKHYNKVNCCLAAPITKLCSLTVTALTSNCNIVVLNKDDYIKIDGKQYSLGEDYKNISLGTYVGLMNRLIEDHNEKNLKFTFDNAGRFILTSPEKFVIDFTTYNVSMFLGFYNSHFPIYSDYNGDIYYVQAESVGFCLSTPILYLTSNVGMQSFRNDIKHDTNIQGSKIVMRLNNSFQADMPIIVNNAEFVTTILSNDLSHFRVHIGRWLYERSEITISYVLGYTCKCN